MYASKLYTGAVTPERGLEACMMSERPRNTSINEISHLETRTGNDSILEFCKIYVTEVIGVWLPAVTACVPNLTPQHHTINCESVQLQVPEHSTPPATPPAMNKLLRVIALQHTWPRFA